MADDYEEYVRMMSQALAGRKNEPEEDYDDLRYALMNQGNEWESDPEMEQGLMEGMMNAVPRERLEALQEYAPQRNNRKLQLDLTDDQNHFAEAERILLNAISRMSRK